MNLRTNINKFYQDCILNELKLMNSSNFDNKITYNSLLYLDLIDSTANCTVSYIANALHIAKSSVTLKVKELERYGLIEKEQSKQDKRTYYLTTTHKTKDLCKIYDRSLKHAIKEIEELYSKEDIQKFNEMLLILTQHFKSEVDEELKIK
ncbi:hypothetical protein AN1V17_18480 [Vallitalea sediminicola]